MLAPLARREHPGQRLRRWGSASPHEGRYLLCRAVRPLGWLDTSPTPIFNGLPFVTPASVRVHTGLAELRVVMIEAASACAFGVRARHGRDTEAGPRQKWAPIGRAFGLLPRWSHASSAADMRAASALLPWPGPVAMTPRPQMLERSEIRSRLSSLAR